MRLGLLALLLLAAPASAAGPTCALLDPEKDPRVALLEAKLLADPEGNWLERAGIDAILKEQKLQALFGPQGVGERVKLGKLLKAEVLVMIRPVKGAKEPTLELIVGETAGGLRLAVRAIPITKNAAADVAALLEGVREGLKRRGEAIREVVAVPPFVSNDLEYTHEHLKGALAKLAEAEALGRKGVVVVELAEAEALAKELALAAPDAKLNRPLPLYLLGEYRHEGTAKDRAVTLKLRAERGGKPVGEPVELKAKAGEGPGAVRKWAAEKLDELAKDETPRPPADPKAEAKTLADRMLLFKRVGNWEESIALAEAALLLDPAQLDLHIAIVGALGDPVALAQHQTHGRNAEKPAEQFARLYRCGLGHIEAYIIGGGDPARHRAVANLINSSFVQQFRTRAYYLTLPSNCTPEVKETLLETGRIQRAVFTRLLAAPSVADSPPETYIDFVYPILTHLTAAEQYVALERTIADLPDRPASAIQAKILAAAGYWASDEQAKYGAGKAYEAFKARVTDGKFQFASASKAELDRLERIEAERKAFRPMPLPVDPQADDVRLTLVKLVIDGKVPAGPEPLKRFYGILAVGPALDVVWDGSNMFTMKEKGKLVPVRLPAGWDGVISDVVFDGKFVWTSCGRSRNAAILAAFDPASGKVWDLSAVDGLPQPAAEDGKRNPSHAIAPLGPGRVCVAGFHGRAWVATVALDPDKGGSAKVIHEARDVPDRQQTDQWKKTTVAFTPASARTLRGSADGKPITRVLIGRSHTGIREIDQHSLLVDPETGAAEVYETEVAGFGYGNASKHAGPAPGGVLYYHGRTGNRDSQLLRMTLPGPRIEAVAKGIPPLLQGIFPEGPKFHLIEYPAPLPGAAPETVRSRWTASWWILEADAKQPRLAGTGLLMIDTVGVSAHYGLYAIAQTLDRDPRREIYTVEIAAPKK